MSETIPKEIQMKRYWKKKEEALENKLVKIAKGEIEEGKYDMGWYAGQLELVRKILKHMDLVD